MTISGTFGDRLSHLWREITKTPVRIGLFAVDVLLLITLVPALRTTPVHVVDTDGRLTAHCGVSYYLFGAPRKAVTSECRDAFGGHALAALIVIVCIALVTFFLVRTIRLESKQEPVEAGALAGAGFAPMTSAYVAQTAPVAATAPVATAERDRPLRSPTRQPATRATAKSTTARKTSAAKKATATKRASAAKKRSG